MKQEPHSARNEARPPREGRVTDHRLRGAGAWGGPVPARGGHRRGGLPGGDVLWSVLRAALDDAAAGTGRANLEVLDAGGGTGGFAVPIAGLGHDVTVVDPSPDSLAALERRAAEAGVTGRVRPVQGDAAELREVVPAGGADLVLCHNVLEYVDDPAAAVSAAVSATRPGGLLSVLVTNPLAAAVHRALAGRFDAAAALLAEPAGRAGAPAPEGLTGARLTALLVSFGLSAGPVLGVRVFADLLPSSLVDGEPGAGGALDRLEAAAATHPVMRELATRLHVLAGRPG